MAAFAKTFLSTGLLATALSLALSSVACGPIVPVSPTWANDIRPLMVSRCIRCHDEPGRIDPDSKATKNPFLGIAAIPNLNYQNFADIPSASLSLVKLSADAVKGKLPGGIPRMPPPPAEVLEDWQIDMLQAWCDYPQ